MSSTENPGNSAISEELPAAVAVAQCAAITAIVPARNEELNIAACVRSLAEQPEIGEIIVVNDQSTDGTVRVLAALRKEIPWLRVIEAGELPAGWLGKCHAVWLGAVAAKGEWLLFTDADVTHLEGSARRALQDAAHTGAALVSYSPDQELSSWGERALMPFVFTRLATRFSYEDVSDPRSAAAAANGQYLLIRRDVYDAVGGHAAVRGEVLEDVALARKVKDARGAIYFARGTGIARTRMYRGFAEMWRGWRKNLYPLLGGRINRVAMELLQAVPWVPLILLCAGLLDRRAGLLGALLLVLWHLSYARQLRRNRYPLSGILYFMPGALLYAGVVLASAGAHRRGRVEWKGRVFTVEP
jgi:glycosyltransferase involved in cell wall biosynthesis